MAATLERSLDFFGAATVALGCHGTADELISYCRD